MYARPFPRDAMADQPLSQLDHKLIGHLKGTFFVPDYQRGYRWGPYEVQALLDDIWENGTRENGPRDYSLQPVVVTPSSRGDWELVDGQQRLTTLNLVLRYIQQNHFPKAKVTYEMDYETRPETAGFIRELHPDNEAANEKKSGENADFFHVYAAWKTIERWFADKESAEGGEHQATFIGVEVYRFLNKNVRVIWYMASGINARELFARLNIGRIPLTSAELVKALLLARSAGEQQGIERAAQ